MCVCVCCARAHFMDKNHTFSWKSTSNVFTLELSLHKKIHEDTILLITVLFSQNKRKFDNLQWIWRCPWTHWRADWLMTKPFPSLQLVFKSPPTSFTNSSSQKIKVLRSILSKAVVVPTCKVRGGALGHRQQLLGRRPWCFLDLHSLENHGGENSVSETEHNHNRLVPLKKKIRQFQITFSFQKYSGHKL